MSEQVSGPGPSGSHSRCCAHELSASEPLTHGSDFPMNSPMGVPFHSWKHPLRLQPAWGRLGTALRPRPCAFLHLLSTPLPRRSGRCDPRDPRDPHSRLSTAVLLPLADGRFDGQPAVGPRAAPGRGRCVFANRTPRSLPMRGRRLFHISLVGRRICAGYSGQRRKSHSSLALLSPTFCLKSTALGRARGRDRPSAVGGGGGEGRSARGCPGPGTVLQVLPPLSSLPSSSALRHPVKREIWWVF